MDKEKLLELIYKTESIAHIKEFLEAEILQLNSNLKLQRESNELLSSKNLKLETAIDEMSKKSKDFSERLDAILHSYQLLKKSNEELHFDFQKTKDEIESYKIQFLEKMIDSIEKEKLRITSIKWALGFFLIV